jgi:hypothetical protein
MFGLGFSFSAKDKGLLKYARKAQTGFSDLGATIQLVGEQAGRFTSQSMNLTTTLEASRFNAAKSARMAAANMGLEAGARRQMVKDTVRLNEAYKISTSTAINATKAFARSGDSLKAWGLTVDDAAKQGEAFGIDNEKLGSSISRLADLTKMKLTDKAFKSLGTELGNLAARTTDYGGTMKDLPGIVDRLALAQQNLQLSGEDVQSFAKGIIGLRGDISRMFDDPEIGKQFSENMTDALTGANKGMNQLLSGIKNDIPGVVEQLSIAGFNVEDVFERMKKDPQTFTQELLQSIGKMKEGSAGYKFVRARLEEAFGEPTTAKLFEASAKNADKMAKAFSNAGVESLTMAERAKRGLPVYRTLQESLELMENQLEARLRKAFKGGRAYVRETGRAFREFGDRMNEIAKGKGLAGQMARKMAEIHQIGAQALLPKALQPMAAVLGTVANRMAPVIARLADMGVLALDAWTPLRAVAAAGTAVAVMIKLHGKDKTIKKILKTLRGFFGLTEEAAKKGKGMLSDVKKMMLDVWEVVTTVWARLWPEIKPKLEAAWTGIKQFASGIFGVFTGEAGESKSEMQEYGRRVGKWLARAWVEAVAFWKERVGPIISDMWKGFTGQATSGSGAGEVGRKIAEVLTSAWKYAAEKLFPVMEAGWEVFAKMIGELMSLVIYKAVKAALPSVEIGGQDIIGTAFEHWAKPEGTTTVDDIGRAISAKSKAVGLESDISSIGEKIKAAGYPAADATQTQTKVLGEKLERMIRELQAMGLSRPEAAEEAELRIRHEAAGGGASNMPATNNGGLT